MDQRQEKNRPAKKKPGIPPGLILLFVALIIFGIMFAFMFFENQNPDWLRPAG